MKLTKAKGIYSNFYAPVQSVHLWIKALQVPHLKLRRRLKLLELTETI